MKQAAPKAEITPPNTQKNINRLRKIEKLTRKWESGACPPRSIALLVCVSVILISICISIAGIMLPDVYEGENAVSYLCFMAVCGSFVWFIRSDKGPENWQSLMNDVLVSYIPANHAAFQSLQAATLAEGELRVTQVRQWLDKEIPAMAQLPAPVKPHRKFWFAESLNETKDGERHV